MLFQPLAQGTVHPRLPACAHGFELLDHIDRNRSQLSILQPIHAILNLQSKSLMGRNLYILAATLAVLAAVSIVLSFTNVASQPGSPGDASLWRTTSLALICVALMVTLAGVLSSLFEQAERRASTERQQARRQRRVDPE
jgi:hypothetical protein